MNVMFADPARTANDPRLRRVSFEELLRAADYVVCLAPANAETENMFDAQAFAQMKPTAFFINAARGNLVDESELERALDDGRIGGCALDVGRAPDQMPTPGLARHPKVVATPHVGGLTPQSTEHQALETVAQLGAILDGRIPKGALNAERATRLARLFKR
jgi:D-3-phosphoglycerate dehydrogenase